MYTPAIIIFSLSISFTFPGQGSQRPGMGRPWVDHESWELVDEASEVADRDVGKLLLDADADELRDTRNAQLTTFVSSLMVLDAVERLGIEPSFCAGHSLGEYTALTATGALGFDDGVRLVVARAGAMHEAGLAQPGTMAAVLGLDDDQVDVACRAPTRTSGSPTTTPRARSSSPGRRRESALASDHAKELGAKKVMPLPVSGAFHTPFMISAATGCAAPIADADPATPRSRSSPTSTPSPTSEGKEWASLLSAQLSSPVRWKQCLLELDDLGVTSSSSSAPAGAHRDGQATRRRPARSRSPRPRTSTS